MYNKYWEKYVVEAAAASISKVRVSNEPPGFTTTDDSDSEAQEVLPKAPNMRKAYNKGVQHVHSSADLHKNRVLPSTSNKDISEWNGEGNRGPHSYRISVSKGGKSSDTGNVYDFQSDSEFDNNATNVVPQKSVSLSTLSHRVQDKYVAKKNATPVMQLDVTGKGKAGQVGHVKNPKQDVVMQAGKVKPHVPRNKYEIRRPDVHTVNGNVDNASNKSGNSTVQTVSISEVHSLEGTLRANDDGNSEEEAHRDTAKGTLQGDTYRGNAKADSDEEGSRHMDNGDSHEKVAMESQKLQSNHELSGRNDKDSHEGTLHRDTVMQNIEGNSEDDNCTPNFVLDAHEGGSGVGTFPSERNSSPSHERETEVDTGTAKVTKVNEILQGDHEVPPVIQQVTVAHENLSQQGEPAQGMGEPAVGNNAPLPIPASLTVVEERAMHEMTQESGNGVGPEMVTIQQSPEALHGDVHEDIEINGKSSEERLDLKSMTSDPSQVSNVGGGVNNSAQQNTSATSTITPITSLHCKSGATHTTVKVGNMSSEGMDSSSDYVSTDDTYESMFITQRSPIAKSVTFRSEVGNVIKLFLTHLYETGRMYIMNYGPSEAVKYMYYVLQM